MTKRHTRLMLSDLLDRIDRAAICLVELAAECGPGSSDGIRLAGKAEGVHLIRGYVAEELKRVQR